MYSSPPDFARAQTRMAHEALTRDQETPQILRTALLSGAIFPQDDRDFAAEMQEVTRVITSFLRSERSPSDSRTRRWSLRAAWTVSSAAAFDIAMKYFRASFSEQPLNFELKISVRTKVEAMLSPGLITDRDAALVYGNREGDQRWGIVFHGRQYAALFARWFDDVWSDIPNAYLVIS